MNAKTVNPAVERTQRATRVGVVTSAARQKTIGVTVSYTLVHPKYGKSMRREKTLHAHDEKNEARQGDIVEITECRPLSKTKNWRLLRIVQKAPEQVSHVVAPKAGAGA
ncbi:MAG: 30S ribosomal protein S17 [Phycisphaerae bacterium]|nr:30S ribosomal protein S17 [Phycisphaerae bacterium]